MTTQGAIAHDAADRACYLAKPANLLWKVLPANASSCCCLMTGPAFMNIVNIAIQVGIGRGRVCTC